MEQICFLTQLRGLQRVGVRGPHGGEQGSRHDAGAVAETFRVLVHEQEAERTTWEWLESFEAPLTRSHNSSQQFQQGTKDANVSLWGSFSFKHHTPVTHPTKLPTGAQVLKAFKPRGGFQTTTPGVDFLACYSRDPRT